MMKFRFLRNGKSKFPCLSSQLSTTKGTRSTQKACYTPISSTVQVQGEAGKFGHFTQGGVRVQQVRCFDQICLKMISQHFPSDLGETKLWELIKKRCFSDPFVVVCMSTNMSSFYWAPNGHLIQFAARFGGWSLCPPVKPVRGSRGVRSFSSTTKTGDVPTGKVFKGQIYRCCLFDSPLKSCWKSAPLQQCFFSSLVKPTWSEIAL